MPRRFRLSLLVSFAALLAFAAAQAQTPAPAAEKTDSVPASASKKPASLPSSQIESMLFTNNEMQSIRAAINTYKSHVGTDMFNTERGDVQDSRAASQIYTYPQFFLDSLVYHSPTDWVVWVNNLKITQDTARANTDLTVEAINKNTVTIQWRPTSIDKSRAFASAAKNPPAPGITADKVKGTIQFTLHANQTFSSYVMRVLEGRVLPVTVDLSKEMVAQSITEGQSSELNLDEPPAAPANGQEEGLGGLIDAYKKVNEGMGGNKP